MNFCKGLCEDFKLQSFKSNKRYEDNQKRCAKCEVYIVCSDARCPCCGSKLRSTPRENYARKLHNKEKYVFRN